MSKQKKRALKPGEVPVDARILELVLTSADTALKSVESMGGYLTQLLDAAISIRPDADTIAMRQTVAESVTQCRDLRAAMDLHCGFMRTVIAASRSGLAGGSERVM